MKLYTFVFLFLSILAFSSCSSRYDYKISEKSFENDEKRYALIDSSGTAVTPYVYTEISEENELNGLRRLCFADSSEVYLDKRGEAFFKIEKESDIDKTNEDFVFKYENDSLKTNFILYTLFAIAVVWLIYFFHIKKAYFIIALFLCAITFGIPTNDIINRNQFEGYELVTNEAENLYGLEKNGKLVLDVVYYDAMDYDKMITMLRAGDNKRIFIDTEQNLFVKAGSLDDINKYVISAYDYNINVSVFCIAISIGLVVLCIASMCWIVKKW